MSAQHIPAPWELRQSTSGYWFIDYEQGGEGYTLTKLECGERDARLIAAAPDVLAALRNVIASYRANDPDSMANAVNDAEAAIAKATGEAA
jgi:hypothetical protein